LGPAGGSEVAEQVTTNSNPAPETGFLKQHGTTLLLVAAAGVFVWWRGLYVVDILIAALGLGFIIFIHELGHFLAAKACDVHVKTFSIGFGPAFPFCSHQWGETTYKLAIIPLGGFVSMVGQEDGVVDESADPDPRSYRNKTVPQRMLIISAGVIMNILLAAVCFLVSYMHGIQENPAVVSLIEPGGAAWRAGIRTGDRITEIGPVSHPTFPDLKPIIMSAHKSEQVPVTISRNGTETAMKIIPVREEGAAFPALGVLFPNKLEVQYMKRQALPGFAPFSAAATAKAADGRPIEAGDAIVAMTDPDDPKRGVTPFRDSALPYFEYRERLIRLADEEVTIQLKRRPAGTETPAPTTSISIPPSYHKDLGLRMRMGPITAIRSGSAAEQSGIAPKGGANPGDVLVRVEVTTKDGTKTIWSGDDRKEAQAKPLDPLRLPHELNRWAESQPTDKTVKLTVRREVDHVAKSVELPVLTWDDSYRFENSHPFNAYSPLPVPGLGFAYHVLAIVDHVTPGGPADAAGIKTNDEITRIGLPEWDSKAKAPSVGKWQEVKPAFWANVDSIFQSNYPAATDPALRTISLTVKRGSETIDVKVVGEPDRSWPLGDRGIELAPATEFIQASGALDALAMGWKRTLRTIRGTYLSLYSMITGRTSVTQINGPITLARVTYLFAGQDVWQMLVLMGVISVNLAVVNFLPIPVLDGGHMVFLAYEGLRGKPPSERVQEYLVYVGLALVGSLMLLSIGMDLWRLVN
jgi:regulator of sigma E protease